MKPPELLIICATICERGMIRFQFDRDWRVLQLTSSMSRCSYQMPSFSNSALYSLS